VFKRALGQLPRPLFDTQVAAALCGLNFSLSYRDIVKTLVDVDLAKQETRSDWLRRPMSEAQLRYAADDVYYLQHIHQYLATALEHLGRDHWLAEDMAAKVAAISADVQVEDYYTRIKGAARLDRQGLAILQRLCSWRENEARQQDRPRGRILTDSELLEIAVHKPCRHARLAAVVNLHPRTVRLHGQRVIDTVNQVLEDSENCYPPLLPAPLPRECSALIKACQARVTEIAGEVGVAQEILARRSDVEHIVRTLREGKVSLPPLLATGWRRDVIGTPLLAFARSLEPRFGPSVPDPG